MAKYKYPAPFDRETPPVNILEISNAPIPPCPPFAVDIPVETPTTPVLDSLYRDVMGDDLSLIYMALDAPWVSPEQSRLAEQIVDGRKDLNSLSTAEVEILDDLVRRYNGGDHEKLRTADSERLPLPRARGGRGEEDQEVQPGPKDDLQSDVPEPSDDITSAYDWLEGDD